jgi:hypothetical protein
MEFRSFSSMERDWLRVSDTCKHYTYLSRKLWMMTICDQCMDVHKWSLCNSWTLLSRHFNENSFKCALARRSGIVVIASAYRTTDPGFESRQVVKLLGLYTLQCCCRNLNALSLCLLEKKINASKLKKIVLNANADVMYVHTMESL